MGLVKTVDAWADQERKRIESEPPPPALKVVQPPKGEDKKSAPRLTALGRARARRKAETDADEGETTELFRTAFMALESTAEEAVDRVSKTAQDLVTEAEGLRKSLEPKE
jgi:hypothetical protein